MEIVRIYPERTSEAKILRLGPWLKELKSHYRMDQIPSANPNIVKCLIWVAILTLMCSRRILQLIRNANPENANRYTHEVELFIRSKMSTEDWEEAARYFYNQDWKHLIEIIERSKAMVEKKMSNKKIHSFRYEGLRSYFGRNDPCPCGSGKKYKNCCGRQA